MTVDSVRCSGHTATSSAGVRQFRSSKVWHPSPHCERRLTPRSSGAPTAGHQAPGRGTVYIFTALGLASCRRRPLSSNVRHQNHGLWHLRQKVLRAAPAIKPPRPGIAASILGYSFSYSAAARPSEALRTGPRSTKPNFSCLRSALRGQQQRSGELTLRVSSSGPPPAEILQLRSTRYAAAGKPMAGQLGQRGAGRSGTGPPRSAASVANCRSSPCRANCCLTPRSS